MLGGFAVATGPSSQQHILAFAISGDGGLSTILQQATVQISLTRGCVSWLAQSRPAKGDERSGGQGRCTRRFQRVLEGLAVFVGPWHCSERWLEGLILDTMAKHLTHG